MLYEVITDRDDAVTVELPAYHHHATVKVDIPDLQGGRLGDAKPRGVDELEERTVFERNNFV